MRNQTIFTFADHTGNPLFIKGLIEGNNPFFELLVALDVY